MGKSPETDYPDPLLAKHLKEAEKAGEQAAAQSLRESSRSMATHLIGQIGGAAKQEFFRGKFKTDEFGYSRLDPAGFNVQSHIFTNYVRLGPTNHKNKLDLTHDYARIGLDISELFYRRLFVSILYGPSYLQKHPKYVDWDRLFIETYVGDVEGTRIVRDQQAALTLPLREEVVPEQEDILEFRQFLGRISHALSDEPDPIVVYELT